jgi:nucleoside phosphorylase
MKAMLSATHEENHPGDGSGRRYLCGQLTDNRGEKRAVVLTLADPGNNSAAARATKMLALYRTVKSIIMVGIAGGVPSPAKAETHVRLGDIVVSNKKGVIQYDFKKEEPDFEEYRGSPIAPSAELLEAVRLLEAGELEGSWPWERHVQDALKILKWKRPSKKSDVLLDPVDRKSEVAHPHDERRRGNNPRVFVGAIAAANTLLKNAARRDALREKFGVRAIEMEGSGVADATWQEDRGYLVVRGICDYCDVSKDDEWQKYAAVVAAAYARALIESLPPESASGVSQHADERATRTYASTTWPSSPKVYSPDLADRSKEFALFVSMLTPDATHRAVFLDGPPNHGKTCLVRECRTYVEGMLSADACVIIDFKANGSKEFALETLRLRLRSFLPKFAYPNSTVSDLRSDLDALSRPIVLFFDAYEKASPEARELVEGVLLNDLDRLAAIRMIVAGQQIPDHKTAVWASRVRHFTIGPIDDPTDWSIYAQRFGAVKFDDVRLLTRVTLGVAGTIRPLLDRLVISEDSRNA